jgi:hypothetical protein
VDGVTDRVRRGRTILVAATAACVAVTMLAGAGGAAAGGPKPTATPPPADTSWIYAVNRIGSPTTSWAVAPDGTGLHQDPCWGEWSRGDGPRRVLRVEDVPGETLTVWWGTAGFVQQPVRQIVSRNEACGDARIVYEAAPGMFLAGTATWSPDGRRVAFPAQRYDARGQMTDQGIWVGDVDGSCGTGLCNVHEGLVLPMVELTRDETAGMVQYAGMAPVASWSPDNRTVAYVHQLGGDPYTRGAFTALLGEGTTSDEVRVPVGDYVYAAAFSPVDGNRLAVHLPNRSNACRNSDLAIVSPTGVGLSWVTTSSNLAACSVGQWAWSPDGGWLAFNAAPKSGLRDDIWKIRPGAAKATLVLATPGAFYTVTGWR